MLGVLSRLLALGLCFEVGGEKGWIGVVEGSVSIGGGGVAV